MPISALFAAAIRASSSIASSAESSAADEAPVADAAELDAELAVVEPSTSPVRLAEVGFTFEFSPEFIGVVSSRIRPSPEFVEFSLPSLLVAVDERESASTADASVEDIVVVVDASDDDVVVVIVIELCVVTSVAGLSVDPPSTAESITSESGSLVSTSVSLNELWVVVVVVGTSCVWLVGIVVVGTVANVVVALFAAESTAEVSVTGAFVVAG